jgi:hypothetical protein
VGAFTHEGRVHLCPYFFEEGSNKSHILIHEAAHQAGLLEVDVYQWEDAFNRLPTNDALRNPDSYTMFVLNTQPRLVIGPAELIGRRP